MSFWESTNRRARAAVAAAARRQPPPEEQAPPRPRVPYQQGREFVVRAESVLMLAGESVQTYVAQVYYEVFRFNTVFDLTDEDRGHILWNGLRREIRQRVRLPPGFTYAQFVDELQRCEAKMNQEEREAELRAHWRREFPYTNTRVRHPDTVAVTSRHRLRRASEMEEHPVPDRRVRRHIVMMEQEEENGASTGSNEDPTKYPDKDDEIEVAPTGARRSHD